MLADFFIQCGVDFFANQNRATQLLRERLEPRGEIHGVADDCGLEALRLTDGAHHHVAHVDANADGEGRAIWMERVRCGDFALHGDSGAHCVC